MKQFSAFLKKEFTEHIRSGRMMIMGIIFVIIGVMNPAVAKLTPWLLEMFSESLEGTGVVIRPSCQKSKLDIASIVG